MKRAMAKQAEAERERRAKVINAEGEYQASTKLIQAAEVIEQFPVAIQLRFLQTVAEVAVENNSTTLFPIPIDLFSQFVKEPSAVTSEGKARALKLAKEAALASLPDSAAASGTLADTSAPKITKSERVLLEGSAEDSETIEPDDTQQD